MEHRADSPYPFLPDDPRAEPYFRGLSEAIQNQIKALRHYPATYQELMDAVDAARQAQQ